MIVTRPNSYSANQVIDPAQVNADFNTLYNDYNGNIDDTNIKAAAGIKLSKLEGDANGRWMPANETWTYASATTFTVTGDVSAKYQKGDKIRLKQGGAYKYFYIVAVSFAAGTTTITVTGGSDYSLANAAITNNDFSRATQPVGFPQWFNYAPTVTGYSSVPTGTVYRFRIDGNTVTVTVREATNGTSNATTLTISLPVGAKTLTNAFWTGPMMCYDSGTLQSTPGILYVSSADTVMTGQKNYALAAWTASGAKGIPSGAISYEI